jgi:hypothetical protein
MKLATKNKKAPRRSNSTTLTLQQQHISLGVGIDPDAAEIANHPITTLRIFAITTELRNLTCNFHHPSVALALVDDPPRANVVVRIVSCPDASVS